MVETLATLRALAASLPLAEGTRWYVFGSVLQDDPLAADLDVLILYPEGHDTANLRRAVEDFPIRLPIDLYMMTAEEEREFDFIRSEGARLVFPVFDDDARASEA